MRTAYALLGLTFLVVFGLAYLLVERAHAPGQPQIQQAPDRSSYESNEAPMLTLTSPAFAHGAAIPAHYTCEGENLSPELSIDGVPEGTVSLALTMIDPDIPESVRTNMGIDTFDHWVVFNMPADTRTIEPGVRPVGVTGMNSAGQGYTGPCPPDREHRYIFTLYAVDTVLPLNASAHRADLEAALRGHVIQEATLLGVYEKHN